VSFTNRGPVFLVCGGSDRVWDSCPYLKGITDRLTTHHFRYPTTVLRYPAAGHLVGPLMPYLSFISTQVAPGIATGGTVLADEQASADAWPKLLAFLTHTARLGG
jgi:BAAT / Acyl-CoA thioester hydrolase C terminal